MAEELKLEEDEKVVKSVLEKFEKKRDFAKPGRIVVAALAIAASLYHLFYAYFHPYFALNHRSLHVMFMFVLLFILYPFSKKRSPRKRVSVLDVIFLALTAGICLWIFINSSAILNRAGAFLIYDVIVGIVMVLLVLEAARRATGWAVPAIAVIFILYALLGPYLPYAIAHKGYSIKRISTYLALSMDGIFSIPIGVSSNFILLFILYGAILRKTGAGQFFTDIAFALTGGAKGGPAKAAVVSSTFFGMISGSSVANTVTTGSFTIPLMKKTGYPSHFAAGVEASASTMGQIMPPIMGAAAFIMAEFLGITYISVCIAAAIPASLSFFATFLQVHFRAVTLGLKGLPKESLPSIKKALVAGWYHVFSIFLLIFFLVQNFSPERAVFWAIVASIVSSFIMAIVRKEPLKEFGKKIIEGLKEGSLGAVEVAAACAAAGIIIGSITMSGLGIKFSSYVVDISGGNLFLALPFTMIACILLGMGVPTTAQYIIISSLVAPALVNMGVLAISAHLFVLYFGTRADITPPVALAAYAGAGIARSDPWKTGLSAFQLGIAGYIVPFMFVFAPELLMIGSFPMIILRLTTAIIGIFALAAAVQKCWIVKARWYEVILLFAAALLMIRAGWITNISGLAILAAVYLMQRIRKLKIKAS